MSFTAIRARQHLLQGRSNSSRQAAPIVLTINVGSSGIKFAAFASESFDQLLHGQIERTSTQQGSMTIKVGGTDEQASHTSVGVTFDDWSQAIVSTVDHHFGAACVTGIGHRVVQGGPRLLQHQRITDDLVAELHRNQPIDLEHLPGEIAVIQAFRTAFPHVPQFACFDTVFHRDLPRVAQLLPVPNRFSASGVRRFGFHGLSYTYLMQQLAMLAGPAAANGRVILAHLGSGASMAAVLGGKSVDTTMGFTSTSGLMMGTRPGDLDPGLLLYLAREQNFDTAQMEHFIAHECGLLGVSGTSADVRELISRRYTDSHAANALDLFCYQAKKHLCALTAALGGVDTIVFSGGIGEHSAEVREDVCNGLSYLGITIDPSHNKASRDVISTATSRVAVRIIPTDEEVIIAHIVNVESGRQNDQSQIKPSSS